MYEQEFKEIKQRVALRVRRLRVARRLTQEALATEAGLAHRHLQKLEAAELNITIETLAKLARALQVDIVELVQPE